MASQTSLQLGLECLKEDRIDEAIQHLEKAAEQYPNDVHSFQYLGIAYAKKQSYNRAVGAFQAALQLRPNAASIHYNLGLAYQADGVPQQAREHFQQALLLDPGYLKAADALETLDAEVSGVELVCARHPDEPAVGVCVFCQLPVCEQCKTVVQGQICCAKCASTQAGR